VLTHKFLLYLLTDCCVDGHVIILNDTEENAKIIMIPLCISTDFLALKMYSPSAWWNRRHMKSTESAPGQVNCCWSSPARPILGSESSRTPGVVQLLRGSAPLASYIYIYIYTEYSSLFNSDYPFKNSAKNVKFPHVLS
jgi:hypothetical protein